MSGVKNDVAKENTKEMEKQLEEKSQAPLQQEISEEERRDKRFQEWGDQFDIWLIRAAKKRRPVECILADDLAGITQKGKVLQGVPLRVDKNQVQFLINDDEVWIDRSVLVTARHVAPPATESK